MVKDNELVQVQAMKKISDLTEKEFIEYIYEILKENTAETDDRLDDLLDQFEKITEHPDGTDLIYYPEKESDGTPEKITEIVKKWRFSNGLSSFKIK